MLLLALNNIDIEGRPLFSEHWFVRISSVCNCTCKNVQNIDLTLDDKWPNYLANRIMVHLKAGTSDVSRP